ncbi:LuxR C-terminal-related transcriptional regulator [Paenibacillus sp. 2TAB26]|uniref:LuxR C-terminal-related transcriptional regulator n=1 Tax=Paenibacillus sp. 2TAB26 TaxID=3233005 RepID=UPI003F9DC30E
MNENLIDNPLINNFFWMVGARFSLTRRKLEVVQFLSLHGSTNRELCHLLGISEKITQNHISNIQIKLNARSKSEIQTAIFRDTLLPMFMSTRHANERSFSYGPTLSSQPKNIGVG